MSPEQARGEELDGRSDQFSFGLIFYELATGKRAFQRDSAAETMAAIIREDAHPLPATTDHEAFDDAGIPAFQFIQDDREYDSRTHHSEFRYF